MKQCRALFFVLLGNIKAYRNSEKNIGFINDFIRHFGKQGVDEKDLGLNSFENSKTAKGEIVSLDDRIDEFES